MSTTLCAAFIASLALLLAACDPKPATPPVPVIGTVQSDNTGTPSPAPGVPASAAR